MADPFQPRLSRSASGPLGGPPRAFDWRWRLAALLSLAGVLGLFRFAGALFHPVEVLAAALAICMLVWTAGDLARASSSARWEGTGTRSRMNRGRDYRLSYLTKLLGEQDLSAVHQVLTAIVDRTLVAGYGVSRAADPVRSREILGADLHDFLSSPPRSPYDYHRRLPGVLTRIEAL